jgi:hypothetical protein
MDPRAFLLLFLALEPSIASIATSSPPQQVMIPENEAGTIANQPAQNLKDKSANKFTQLAHAMGKLRDSVKQYAAKAPKDSTIGLISNLIGLNAGSSTSSITITTLSSTG